MARNGRFTTEEIIRELYMDSDSDMEPDDDDFMPESDESSDETVSVVLHNERTSSTSAGIGGRRGGRGRNRGRGWHLRVKEGACPCAS